MSKLRLEVSKALSLRSPEKQPFESLEAISSGIKPADLAREFQDLAARHESRFEWPEALAAFRRAWELEKVPKHGLKYAALARRLSRLQEATITLEEIMGLLTDPAARASSMSDLGVLHVGMRQFRKAEEAFATALEIQKKIAKTAQDSYQIDVAKTLVDVSSLYYETLRLPEAEQALIEALSIYRRLSKANVQAVPPHLAATLDNLGLIYSDTGRHPKAEESFREALDIRRKLAEADSWGYLPAVATTLSNFAIHYFKTKEVTQAEQMFEEALAIRRALAEIS